ncbi:unnamed protein product [Thelazia callipaeda]|uniref:SWIB domain-containing protein n=1 Tax=Thelazia callipaeda TaxID=103827 RepID=A0A0N5D041_THECL|nr:unnamed protein product [Thelazia callipaeda]
MYCIDVGEVHDVDANDVWELLPSLYNIPPLCFRLVLKSCMNTTKCNEFATFEKGMICICKICMSFQILKLPFILGNVFPSNYPQRARVLYPPAIISLIYNKNRDGNFVEISCTSKVRQFFLKIIGRSISETNDLGFLFNNASSTTCTSVVNKSVSRTKSTHTLNKLSRHRCRTLVVKSASVPAISRDPALTFMFKKFNVSLPSHLIARVTERIDIDNYIMRDPAVLSDLEKVYFFNFSFMLAFICSKYILS